MDMGFKIIDAIKSNNTCEQICKLNKSGILEKIIPEVKSMKEVGKCKYHKVDCFTHTIYALEEFEKLIRENKFPSHLKDEIWIYLNKEAENNLKNIDLLKLGVFLHDIGKADAKTIDENGRVHFKGHEKFSGEIALNVGENLRLSQNSIKLLYNFTRYHMYLLTLYKKSNTSHDVMKEMFDTLKDDIIGVMLLGFADINATKKLIEPIENEEVLKTYVYYILTVYLYKYKKNVSFQIFKQGITVQGNLQIYSNYKIDFDCIGVDNITDVLVEPIVLILSITLSNSYISFTITLSKEQSSPVI